MAKSNDKRLAIARRMPQGLRKKHPGQDYTLEGDEVLTWVMEQPELVNALVSMLVNWGYICYDRESGTWGGADHAD